MVVTAHIHYSDLESVASSFTLVPIGQSGGSGDKAKSYTSDPQASVKTHDLWARMCMSLLNSPLLSEDGSDLALLLLDSTYHMENLWQYCT